MKQVVQVAAGIVVGAFALAGMLAVLYVMAGVLVERHVESAIQRNAAEAALGGLL